MFAKATIAILAIAFILGLIYLMGMAIYNHFLNSRRRDKEELEEAADELEYLMKKAKRNNEV